MAIRRTASLAALALAGAFLWTLPARAYLIILKDGTRIEAAAKPVVSGRNYLFHDKLGAQKMIAISEVDPAKTDAANKENYRDAYVLGEPEPMKKEPATAAKRPSLSEYIRQNRKSDIAPPPLTAPAVPVDAPSAKGTERAAAAAASTGSVDPIVLDAFLRAYQSSAVRGTRLTQLGGGTIRVQMIADTETVVLGALVGTARGLKEARTAGRLVEKVELFMATSVGENAGKFLMTPEDADSLLNGAITPARYFVANLQL